MGRLESLADWKRQIGKVYRLMRRGELATSEGTRLIYALEAGARIAREESREQYEREQREQIARLEQQLRELQAVRNGQLAALPPPNQRTEDLPAWAREE